MNTMRKVRGATSGSVLLLTFGVGWLMIQQPLLNGRIEHATGQVSQLQPQVATLSQNQQKLTAGLAEANRRLVALGKTPVPTPTLTPAATPDGLDAEETAAVRLIVADQLALQKVTITQAEITQIARVAAQLVPKPADGKSPTVAQIQPVVTAALAAYCTGDKCVGKTGTSGRDGRDGTDGKDAPKVTDAELLKAAQQALAAYCAGETSPCDGKVGPSGQDGADAPVMVDMDCLGDGNDSYWRMQFDKGPDKTAMGPCRIGPEPHN